MGFTNWLKNVLGIEDKEEASQNEAVASTAAVSNTAPAVALPMDEAEKTLVAVMAACIAGKDQPDADLQINRITRIQ